MQARNSIAGKATAPGALMLNSGPSQASLLLAAARNAAFAEASQGRVGQGLALLADALEQEPMSHDLMSDIAALLLSAGELDHAAAYAERALEIAPAHGASLYTLGFALAGLGESARASLVLEALCQGEPLQSLQQEAPDLLPLVRTELDRLHGQQDVQAGAAAA
jgi:tetratricopeptide (TPR) repeat protein